MKNFILSLFLTFLVCTCFAQTKGLMYSVSTEIGNNLRKNTGFASIDVAFTPGYAFDGRFFVGVPLTLSNELFRTDGVQTYESNFRMGISAGYNILSHDNGIVSLSAAFGGSPKAAQGGPTSAIIPIFDCGVPKKHMVSIRLRRQQIFSAPGRLFPTTYFSYFCRSRCGSRVIHTADSRNSSRKRLTSTRTNGRYAHMARPPRSRSWFCFDER